MSVDFHPGCPVASCPCHILGRPCPEFMGLDGARFCPRCGWASRRHSVAALAVDGAAYRRRTRRRKP